MHCIFFIYFILFLQFSAWNFTKLWMAKHSQAVRLYEKHDNGHGLLVGIPTVFLKRITEKMDDGKDLSIMDPTPEDDFCDEPAFAQALSKDPRLALRVIRDPVKAQKEIDKFNKKKRNQSSKKNESESGEEDDARISSSKAGGGKNGGTKEKGGKSGTNGKKG